ncbi:MAG: hypothetical protein HYX69_10615 [Planctomycetia bacterium]|nr:hypothetical protein [Planctomycetia bacterium]
MLAGVSYLKALACFTDPRLFESGDEILAFPEIDATIRFCAYLSQLVAADAYDEEYHSPFYAEVCVRDQKLCIATDSRVDCEDDEFDDWQADNDDD